MKSEAKKHIIVGISVLVAVNFKERLASGH